MKGSVDRTKVVIRHLPPTITEAAFIDQIEDRFGGRYSFLSFRPGKPKQRFQLNARSYINFTKPEDVVEFAEFFNGHVFVNEKGTQFKATVEYAPCQRVRKQLSKKDGREGTIGKDPDYLEFLEAIAKPVENLPSAEVQLDRREAERGAAKNAPVVTPLMDFIRQKRAAKNESRRIMSNGKLIRKGAGAFGSPSSASSRRSSDKRRVSTTMYVQRNSAKSASGKDKSTYSLVPKQDQFDKPVLQAAASAVEISEGRSGTSGTIYTGKKILLLKGKEKEFPLVSGGMPLQQSETFKSAVGSNTFKQNQHRETSGRIFKSMLLNKDARQSRSLSDVHSAHQIESSKLEKDRRLPRPQNFKPFVKDTNGVVEDKLFKSDVHNFPKNKHEKRTRNKDRPDRGVWTPLRRSDGSHASDESLSSLTSRDPQKHNGRKGMSHDGKESDGSYTMNEGKPLKRGGPNYSSHEKQVWVQKSNAGP